MKITVINRQVLRLIEEEMEAACQSVANKHGLSIAYKGGGRFGPSNATLPFEVAVLTKGGEALSAEVTEYQQYAGLYGLDPEMLNSTVRFNGSLFTITGLTTRRPRFPINAISQRGTRYKLPLDGVKRAWELQEKAKKPKVVAKPTVVAKPAPLIPVESIADTMAAVKPAAPTGTEHNVASTSDILGVTADDIRGANAEAGTGEFFVVGGPNDIVYGT